MMEIRIKKWTVLLVSSILLVGNVQVPVEAKELTDAQKILHVLDRLSYGPRPGDIEMVKTMGIENYIQSQLSPQSILEPPDLLARQDRLETLKLSPKQLYDLYGQPQSFNGQPPSKSESQAAKDHARLILKEAEVMRLMRALESPRQLQEVMTDFWFNHFNVYRDKDLGYLWVGSFEQTIRWNALGRFRDLLGATAHHPEMLIYLDNWKSTVQGKPDAQGRTPGLNENYARELMELHTLGVDGGYTQDDVITLARILTGWGISLPNTPDLHGYKGLGRAFDDGKGFYFDPRHHDFGSKTLLQQSFPGITTGTNSLGMDEGERALDILAKSPATAHHISYMLAQYFVADEPPKGLVSRMTSTYQETDGNIREVLKIMFHSNEFWSPKYFNNKFKTPYIYLLSTMRATGLKVSIYPPLLNTLNLWGMPLYSYLTPDGYKNTEDAWKSPDALSRRISFASELGHDNIPLNMELSQHKKPPQYQPPNDFHLVTVTTPPTSLSFAGMPQASFVGGQNNKSPMPRQTVPKTGWINPYQLRLMYASELSEQTQSVLDNEVPEMWSMTILGCPELMYH